MNKPALKPKAEWTKCSGYKESPYAHEMRDGCTTCAPYWIDIPICPVHVKKLAQSGYCKGCHKYYDLWR